MMNQRLAAALEYERYTGIPRREGVYWKWNWKTLRRHLRRCIWYDLARQPAVDPSTELIKETAYIPKEGPVFQAIYEYMLEHGPATRRELCKTLNLPSTSVFRLLTKHPAFEPVGRQAVEGGQGAQLSATLYDLKGNESWNSLSPSSESQSVSV